MKIKTQLTLASIIAAGLLASGCSQQMVAQQAAADPVVVAPPAEPMVKTVVDCTACKRPVAPRPQPQRPRPSGNKWTHGHPAVPACTDSVKHTHKYNNRGHKHAYSCKKGMMRPAPRPAPVRPRPAPAPRPAGHTHPAVPGCTNSVTHNHKTVRGGNHSHRYACQRPAPRPVMPRPVVRPMPRPLPPVQRPVPMMPKVKAKGTYRGPIRIDGVMQQYQQ